MADYYLEPAGKELKQQLVQYFPVTIAPGGAGTPPHMHPAIEMLYFISGRCRIRDGRQYWEVGAGDLALFRGGTVHAVSLLSQEESTYYVLTVHPSLIFSTFSGVGAAYPMAFLTEHPQDRCLFRQVSGETKQILEAITALYRESRTVSNPLLYSRLRAKVSDLLSCMVTSELQSILPGENQRLPDESVVRQIYDSVLYIDSHFEQPLSPFQCAEQLHMSYSYYAKRFFQVTGRTFKQYLTEVRLSHAESTLLASDWPVTEIALACGYSNVSYFISEFRRYKGRSPLAFRKAMTSRK